MSINVDTDAAAAKALSAQGRSDTDRFLNNIKQYIPDIPEPRRPDPDWDGILEACSTVGGNHENVVQTMLHLNELYADRYKTLVCRFVDRYLLHLHSFDKVSNPNPENCCPGFLRGVPLGILHLAAWRAPISTGPDEFVISGFFTDKIREIILNCTPDSICRDKFLRDLEANAERWAYSKAPQRPAERYNVLKHVAEAACMKGEPRKLTLAGQVIIDKIAYAQIKSLPLEERINMVAAE
ncbi:hypothetical protein D4R52_03260 [bacterium]|nr:MAG: hypothetical protein D4R52_03260 [bacterium]